MSQNYWDKVQRSRITRRRLLGGTVALSAGIGAMAVVGCSKSNNSATKTGTAPSTSGGATAEATAKQSSAVTSRGGIYRSFTFDALSLDTFDPHQTQFGPMYNMHSAVFSKVLKYDDETTQELSADLAEGMPEQPDKTTYIFHLRKGVKFHDSPRVRANFPTLAGRELTADDVKYSIERQTNPSSTQKALYYRRGQWESIDKIDIVDPYTIRFTTKSPTSPFLHYFADRNAFIVAKETVDASDTMNSDKAMVGTGPFFLDDFQATQFVKVRRNPNWFAKDDNPHNIGMDRPFIDGYDSLWTPSSNSAEEAALRSKQIDSTAFEDDTTAVSVGKSPGLVLYEYGVSGWVNSRLWLSSKSPLRDFRLRKALHLAIDRKAVSDQMFPPAPGLRSYLVSGPITYPITLWSIPQGDLERMPGYRADSAGRAEDIAEAKSLWAAANGPTSMPVLFAGVPGYIPNKALPEFKRQLQETLGLSVQETVDPTGYTSLAQALLQDTSDADQGTTPFTWGYDNGWIDLDDWLYPYFHTGGTKNSFLLSDPDLDRMIESQRAEFDQSKRRQIGLDTQNYLLNNVLARLDYSAPVSRFADWTYVKNEVFATWFGSNFLYANTWLDQSDPTYNGRAA